jgi:hypothetical protein
LLYHSTRPFDLEVWHVKNDTVSLTLQVLGNLLTPWRLPLLFMISRLGTSYALGLRTPGRYVADRATRLLIPLVAGMLLVVPPQVYFERIGTWMPRRMSPIDFHGSFIEFYPHIFDGVSERQLLLAPPLVSRLPVHILAGGAAARAPPADGRRPATRGGTGGVACTRPPDLSSDGAACSDSRRVARALAGHECARTRGTGARVGGHDGGSGGALFGRVRRAPL